jgi:stage II sporulation protein P
MKRWLMIITVQVGLMFLVGGAVAAQDELDRQYFTMKDTGDRIICRTAQRVVVGDRYLNSANRLYEVVKVKGLVARVRIVGSQAKAKDNPLARLQSSLWELWQDAQSAVRPQGPICIYHTHTDESYLPTEGVNSRKVRGGIVDVGSAIAKAFEEKGIPVVHSNTSHVPHDGMAYDRSRRTAVQLLKQRPRVLLDIHRDAVPRSEYLTMVDQRPTAKIQMVVGRQNPNFQACNEYAKQVKAAVDQRYPGLIKGIFYGKGKYNQDLGPRCLLLECGTNTCSEAEAMRGARAFAAAATNVLYRAAGNRSSNMGSWRSFWIITLVVAGVIGFFLLINRRGLATSIGREFGGPDEHTDRDEKDRK